MTEKIRIENVVKIYGRTPKQQPLKLLQQGVDKDEIFRRTNHVVGLSDVNITVKEGEIFVVMGLSGSGKSTLIRCVNRLIEPTSGDVFIDDQNVTELNKQQLRELRRKKLAMVFQHFGLFPHKTVGYNVAYGLKVRGDGEKDRHERTVDALKMVGLADWIDHYPHNLSGGMQQRIGLARALATDANILLMDEAFSALDPLIRREMQDELINLQQRLQKTILFITHDLGEALRVGDRIAIMRDGYVVQVGTPQQIITEPADEYVAEFIADVDSGRVLTAEFIMSPADPVEVNKHSIDEALKRMDKKDTHALYAVNKNKHVEGILHRRRLQRMKDEGKTKLQDAVRGDYPKSVPTAQLNELYNLSTSGDPIAIINDHGQLEGVVYPLHIFDALAKHGYTADEEPSDEETVQSNGASKSHENEPVEAEMSAGD
jgi:glycine betaine/proline transport system ATP-binding protein